MKASELRIGNYVQNKNKYFDVFGINNNEITLSVSKNSIDYFNLTDLEPIPLTEEWLLKFGFLPSLLNIKNYIHQSTISFELRNVSILDGGFKIRLGVDEAFSFNAISGEIQFVHQLQNLYFSLCGVELEIK